ncbi:MAG TPA: BlaI/MecI/CopY family transcriptional regulator [bacterium]|nr:BlaI/MecI/CopY family transcriptional regulator [bacterium]
MSKRVAAWVFRARGRGLTRVLGSLEAEVMEEVWRQGETTIRRVWDALARRRSIAFNTVMTVMNRLAGKGILVRRGHSGAYRFAAREPRDAFMARVSHEVAQGLIRDFGEHAVAQFVTAVRAVDPAKLRTLRRALAEQEREGARRARQGRVAG